MCQHVLDFGIPVRNTIWPSCCIHSKAREKQTPPISGSNLYSDRRKQVSGTERWVGVKDVKLKLDRMLRKSLSEEVIIGQTRDTEAAYAKGNGKCKCPVSAKCSRTVRRQCNWSEVTGDQRDAGNIHMTQGNRSSHQP